MVTEKEVRDFLSNLSTERVPPETIELQIEVANTVVESEKSIMAKSEQVKDAKLVYASWLTILAYASEMERSVGTVPAPLMTHQSVLEMLANKLLDIVKRGAPVYKPANEQYSTLLEQYMEGELDEDYDFY